MWPTPLCVNKEFLLGMAGYIYILTVKESNLKTLTVSPLVLKGTSGEIKEDGHMVLLFAYRTRNAI